MTLVRCCWSKNKIKKLRDTSLNSSYATQQWNYFNFWRNLSPPHRRMDGDDDEMEMNEARRKNKRFSFTFWYETYFQKPSFCCCVGGLAVNYDLLQLFSCCKLSCSLWLLFFILFCCSKTAIVLSTQAQDVAHWHLKSIRIASINHRDCFFSLFYILFSVQLLFLHFTFSSIWFYFFASSLPPKLNWTLRVVADLPPRGILNTML